MSPRLRTTVLRLTVLLCCWLRTHHRVFAANITVNDTSSSIMYSPQTSWISNSSGYHEGINPADSVDNFTTTSSSSTPSFSSSVPPSSTPANPDSTSSFSSAPVSSPVPSSPTLANPDTPSSSSTVSLLVSLSSTPPPTQTSSPTAPTTSSPVTSSPSSQSTTDDEIDDDEGSHHKKSSRQLVRPRQVGSADIAVTLSFNFTGSAIYIFCIPPVDGAADDTPRNMNLLFTLDNQPYGNFISTACPQNNSVLSLDGLSDTPHQIVVTVGDHSVFLFDYLIYTHSSDSTDDANKSNNVATFAAAVGGSVGVLSLISLGIAISIIRRRMLAARRERLDKEANPTESTTGSSDRPSMSGPAPFVPRYFPDTIIPADPPTYIDALSTTNHNSAPLLASVASSGYVSRQRSYADIPPASPPPPPLEEMPPPPPFPSALSEPIPDLPTGVIIPIANQTSDNSPYSPSSCERAPLLLSSESDMRPNERMSTSFPQPLETSLQPPDGSLHPPAEPFLQPPEISLQPSEISLQPPESSLQPLQNPEINHQEEEPSRQDITSESEDSDHSDIYV